MPTPEPGAGEVRIKLAASGINPGDVKKRENAFGYGMPFPRIIPHSDGAGTLDAVGKGVSETLVGSRVWCYGAQTYRPFGTAAEYTVVPAGQAIELPEGASFEVGACLGIPTITAHRSVHVGGSVDGKTVLVQGGAGAVGSLAVLFAKRAGARVIATVGNDRDRSIAESMGADDVIMRDVKAVASIKDIAPEGVDHIVEVALDANLDSNVEILAQGGSIATYATGKASVAVPVWLLVFVNGRLYFVGSDDVPVAAKEEAVSAVSEALRAGWKGPEVAKTYPLEQIAPAHESVERPSRPGRVIVTI
ncbi:MAG: NADPH:quinone reductase [bacterium]|nr:NADPH:quinone reductase [bacterium]